MFGHIFLVWRSKVKMLKKSGMDFKVDNRTPWKQNVDLFCKLNKSTKCRLKKQLS